MTVADIVAIHVHTLTSLLSEPACRLIKPINIDYNFIEVEEGYCFNIEKKVFELQPKDLKGSPQAFVKYKYIEGEVPRPRRFTEGKN